MGDIIKKNFKDDGTTRRCQEGVYVSGGMWGSFARQCRSTAKFDENKRCRIHSKAGKEARIAKREVLELNKARALLTKHGEL